LDITFGEVSVDCDQFDERINLQKFISVTYTEKVLA